MSGSAVAKKTPIHANGLLILLPTLTFGGGRGIRWAWSGIYGWVFFSLAPVPQPPTTWVAQRSTPNSNPSSWTSPGSLLAFGGPLLSLCWALCWAFRDHSFASLGLPGPFPGCPGPLLGCQRGQRRGQLGDNWGGRQAQGARVGKVGGRGLSQTSNKLVTN